MNNNKISQSHINLNSQKTTQISSIHITIINKNTISNNNLTIKKNI